MLICPPTGTRGADNENSGGTREDLLESQEQTIQYGVQLTAFQKLENLRSDKVSCAITVCLLATFDPPGLTRLSDNETPQSGHMPCATRGRAKAVNMWSESHLRFDLFKILY
jgi:hypothetical protein